MLKVFLVEDESVVREGLRDSIPWEQCGFQFAGEASDGEMALPLVRRIKPDVLITDIKMPFMDGLDFSRLVSRELPNTRIIILSGYDDFNYARQAIELHVDQYLLKPISKASMIEALEQTRRRIEEEREQQQYLQRFTREAREYERYSRRAFFEKLMNGALSVQEIYEQAEKLELELDAEAYNLVLFSLLPQQAATAYSEELALLQEELIEYFLRYPDYLLFRCSFLSYAVLIKGAADKLPQLTQRCADAIEQRCRARAGVDWYVAIGTPTERLSGLSQCYAQANHVLAYRHLMPRQHVLTAEMVRRGEDPSGSYDAVDAGMVDPMLLRGFLHKGLDSEVGDFVSEFFGNLGGALASMIFRHYLILSVRVNAIAAIRDMGCSREELIRRLPAAEIDMSAQELEHYCAEALHAAIAVRDESSQLQSSDLVDSALHYIDQYYADENISLNAVAKAINISTNYLSAVFSQRMGISFVEYLTQKRMARAKQLLRQSGRRTGEIAVEVGYKDPRYFSFVFKKDPGLHAPGVPHGGEGAMSAQRRQRDRHSISGRIRELIVSLAIPLCVLAAFILLLFLFTSLQYAQVSSNISTASQFSQNFKDEVDLKMYYFVTDYDDALPLEEVEAAEELAVKLLGSTRSRESHRAINSVLNLCANLKACIAEIQTTEGYDRRMHQLETNVYVLTELIQQYMYTYLYHEAGELAALRQRQTAWLNAELIVAALVMAVVVTLTLRKSFKITREITRPIDALYGRVGEIGRGELTAREPVQAEDSKLQALSDGLEEMVTRLNEQMELNRQEQIRLRSMELALVQAQINPHFLYNTLDAIMWLVETGKNDQAVEMVSSLSTYFRSFLSNGKDIITLREEALHVRSYLEIQQVRYRDILRYEIDMDPALADCLIPKMTLQPLVENAIYHGIKPRRGVGTVRIHGRMEDGRVLLEVSDSGVGLSAEALRELRASLERDEGTGFGLISSYKRLQLMYGGELDFRVDSEEGRGTAIRIRIPYRTETEESL